MGGKERLAGYEIPTQSAPPKKFFFESNNTGSSDFIGEILGREVITTPTEQKYTYRVSLYSEFQKTSKISYYAKGNPMTKVTEQELSKTEFSFSFVVTDNNIPNQIYFIFCIDGKTQAKIFWIKPQVNT